MKRQVALLFLAFVMFAFAGCTRRAESAPSQSESVPNISSDTTTSAPSAESPVEFQSEEPRNESAQKTDSPQDDSDTDLIGLNITIGDTVLTAHLDGSPLSQEIAAMLPQTFTMTRLQDREYYSPALSRTPANQGESQIHYQNGDLTYWPGGNTFAIFFDKADTDTVPSGIVIVGKVTSDFSFLVGLPEQIEMTFSLES